MLFQPLFFAYLKQAYPQFKWKHTAVKDKFVEHISFID